MDGFQLAQINVGRLRAPVDSPLVAEFMEALDPINAARRGQPWLRLALPDRGGQRHRGAPVRRRQHPGQHVGLGVGRRPRRVRLPLGTTPRTCGAGGSGSSGWRRRSPRCGGCRPATSRTIEEGIARLEHLRANGPSPHAFTFREPFPAPAASDAARLSRCSPGSSRSSGRFEGRDGDRYRFAARRRCSTAPGSATRSP